MRRRGQPRQSRPEQNRAQQSPTRQGRWNQSADRPVAAAVLLIAAGVVVLAIILAVGSLDGLALSFSATTTPMALFIGIGLIACGVSTWVQPTTRILAGILGFGFSLVALPGANLGGFLIGTILGVLGSAAALAWSPGDREGRREGRRRRGRSRGHDSARSATGGADR